jgi:hypothetical protein
MRLKNLCQIILLCESSCLATSIDKYQKTLIVIPNCSLYTDRCCMPSVKLVLNTNRMGSLTRFAGHPLLNRLSSN